MVSDNQDASSFETDFSIKNILNSVIVLIKLILFKMWEKNETSYSTVNRGINLSEFGDN